MLPITLFCSVCCKGKLRLVYHIPLKYTVSHVTYQSEIAVFRCNNRPSCGKSTRRVGTASLQLRVADVLTRETRETRVWTHDEIQIVANSAYLLAEPPCSIEEWLRQNHISPQAITVGTVGDFIQTKLRDLFLAARKLSLTKDPAGFAPFATLQCSTAQPRRLKRTFLPALN